MLTSLAEADGNPWGPHKQIIHRERKWFDLSAGGVVAPTRTGIAASRWVGHAEDRCEQESGIGGDCHVVGIALQPMAEVTVFAARKLIHPGHLPRGSMRLNEPGLPMRGIFRGAYDVLHLQVPNEMIAEYADSACGQTRTTPLISDHPIVVPVIERLATSLIHAEELGGAFGRSYADGISLAITSQMFGGNSDGALSHRHRMSGLSKWRLKRATEYMEANLAESISLADIAAASLTSRPQPDYRE
jgi:AraC family transcriptional regulator